MIDFYTWGTPNGRKVSIALEEMGLSYNVHPVDIMKNEQFAPDFLKIAPNNKIPAIVDNDTGVTLMESGAILVYLAEKTGKFLPSKNRWQIMEWLMWQMGGFGPMLGQAHYFLHFNPGASANAEERFGTEVKRLYGVLNNHLKNCDFVAEEYSIADMAIWPWVSRFEWQRIDLETFPNILDWYLRICDRSAVKTGYDVPAKINAIPVP